jgi:hypothetical protein
MAHVAPLFPSFSKGEVSPLMFGRIDIEQYGSCLEKCRNMWIRPYGCASRITGTEYISTAKNNGKARLLKFVFSAQDSIIIECGAGYFRFYQDGKQIKKDGEIYEVKNTYQEEQLSSIQYVQLDDIIKLTCLPVGDDYSTAKPKELLRKANNDWEFRDVEFKETPYLDQNITDITLTASAQTGDNIDLKASEDFFNEKHVGAMFWLGVTVEDSETKEQVQGYVKVTEFVNAKQVKAKVMSKLSGASATKIWGEGAFSDYRGYPACVALYDGRLYYARTPHQPRNIYGSVPYAYEKFTPAVDNEDDGAINIQLATNANGDGSDIKWMIGASILLCGTYGGEFIIRGTGDGAITPTDISAKQRTNWGGEPVRPVVAGSFVHFLQRTGKKLRQFQYDYYYDSYKAIDMSIYSEHLLSSPIKEMAYQKAPDSIIYLVREDGDVVMLSLEQDQSVMAWSLLEELNGEVESIETIPAKDGLYDEVWMLLKRKALSTTLQIESSISEDRIENNFNKTESNSGTKTTNLTRTGSGVYFFQKRPKSDIYYYISNGYLFDKRTDKKVDNECGWTKVSMSRCIKNGELYAIFDNSLILIDNSRTWSDISSFTTTSTAPSLGIADGNLYLVGPTSESIELIDNSGTWSKVVNFNTSDNIEDFKYGINDGKLYYIKLDKTYKQIGTLNTWTHVTADTTGDGSEVAYGIAGGSLYKLNGATATKIGSLTSWTDVIGTYDGTDGALGIADNKLYAIRNTTVTMLIGDENFKVEKLGSDLWTSFYSTVIINQNVFAVYHDSTGEKTIKQVTDDNGYTDVWGYFDTVSNSSYCYAIKDGYLYKLYLDGRKTLISDATGHWVNKSNIIYDVEKEFNIKISGQINYDDFLNLTINTSTLGYNRYLERMKNPITTDNPIDWWYVRSGEKINVYDGTIDNKLTISVSDDVITATSSKNYFTSIMKGNTLRIIDDNYNTLYEYIITQINSSTEVLLTSNRIIENAIADGGKWGVGISSIRGLERLNELEVQVFADGEVQNNKIVQNGSIVLDKNSFVVLVGLPYQSYMTTMPLEQGSQNGTAVGKRKRIGEFSVRVWNTKGMKYGKDLNSLYETIYDQEEVYTGVIPNIKYNQGWNWIANITLEQSKPYPMNVLAVAPILTEVDK